VSTGANWDPVPQGAFTEADEWLISSPVRLTLDAATTVGKISLDSRENITFLTSGGAVLTVTRVVNSGKGVARFCCPVQFAGTWLVEQTGAVKFPAGVTATYPDPSIRTSSSSDVARSLDGIFTFTDDWSVPSISDGNHPWLLRPGSQIVGRNLTGSESGGRILYISEGASACFDTVSIGFKKGDIGLDGFLEAKKEVIISGSGGSATLGSGGRTGTIKAPSIRKTAGYIFYLNIPHIFVGKGGIGTDCRDYDVRLNCHTTITATDNFDFLGVYNKDNQKDWCWQLNGKRLVVDVPEGLTATFGVTLTGGGFLYKRGKGTLVLTDTDKNGQSGYVKDYSGGTIIEEGTVRLAAKNQIGTGPVMLRDDGRFEVAAGIAVTNIVTTLGAGVGTLVLEDGASVAVSGVRPCLVKKVELPAGASAAITVADSPSAPASLIAGVSAADSARLTLPAGYAFVGGAAVKSTTAAATDYVWAGASGADWATPGSWRVNGATPSVAPGSDDTIRFENDAPVAVGGSTTLSVAKIVTTTGAAVTFTVPVLFKGRYFVENAVCAPVFAKGATATVPDDALVNLNVPSHVLPDGLTLTADWTIPSVPADNPFVVPAGARVTGKTLTAATYAASAPSLRVDAGAVATFDTIAIARRLVFWMNGGRLVATGDITLGSESGGGNDFGYYQYYNTGVVEANGVYKSAAGGSTIVCYLTEFIIGSGGFGMLYHDYMFDLQDNTRVTAKADMAIHQPLEKANDGDWGLHFINYRAFTVDTAGHRVLFDSYTRGTGPIVKEGAGELVLQNRKKTHTGGLLVKAGQVTMNLVDGAGWGPTTVESGATVSFTTLAGSHSYPMTIRSGAALEWAGSVMMTSSLILEAGSTLRPLTAAPFDALSGSLELPAAGLVTLDLRALTFVDGVPVPVLGGVSPGDEQLFAVLLPENITGSFSVSGGVLRFTSGSALDLFWNVNAGLSVWSMTEKAWTNAAGTVSAFREYSNATIADATDITIPENVAANDVTVSADGDMTLSGAGKIGGSGTFRKTGAGTLTFDVTGGLDGQILAISNGVFKLGDSLKNHALGGSTDATPIIVAPGATVDINYTKSHGQTGLERNRLTHDKVFRIAGDGVDGRGAIVNDNESVHDALTRIELTADASVGGKSRMDIRRGASASDYERTQTAIYGPNQTLTVRNTQSFGIIGADITLKALRIASGATLQLQYNGAINITDGIRLDGGTLYFEYGSDIGRTAVRADSGNCVIRSAYGTGTISGPVSVAPGATLTQTGGDVVYNGTVSGLAVTGGTAYKRWRDGRSVRFIQNGESVDYAGAGFSATGGDVNDNGNGVVLFNGGSFNASADWSIRHYIPLYFAAGWTLNQADGTTVTWNTALDGDGDVTLCGAARLVGDKEVQGAVGGKWTVGEGFSAGVEGAASLLGGLELRKGATVSVDIAADRSAVFTARDFGDRDLSNANSLAGRFNKKLGSSTRGTITHDETFLFTHYDQGKRPFGNMNLSAAFAVGQFYVEPEAAGEWSFEGKCDDRVGLWIDGECVMMSSSDCVVVSGKKTLTAGWHAFRHIITDNSGGFGAENEYQTVGYKYGSMTGFARFNVKNLKMRPAVDGGDPTNTNTVRWSHYKGSSSDVTADTFKRDDFAWDFCCITNTLEMIQWKGDSSTYLNGYTVNRYEGWFFVSKETAGKEWSFRTQYDDRCALWIDGEDTGLLGESGNSNVWTTTLTEGWHRFRIQTADFSGAAGPWNTGKPAVSYQVAGEEERVFTDKNLVLSVCPDGYIQGGVTLASDATLTNGASEKTAVVYGDVTATGTGATMRGAFTLDGGTLAFRNVSPNVRDLSTVLSIENPAADYLRKVGAIAVDFTGKPRRAKIVVCPAGGLTAAEAAAKMVVTQDGEPVKTSGCQIMNGHIVLSLPVGLRLVIR
jgi:autotransporter-associated beta strand protein